MNDQRQSPTNDPLRQVLREWHVEAAPPPRFNEGVWRRIEREQQATMSPWAAIARWLAGWLARPVPAGAFVTVLLAVGLAAGMLQARDRIEQASAQQRSLYLQSVSPYFVASQNPPSP